MKRLFLLSVVVFSSISSMDCKKQVEEPKDKITDSLNVIIPDYNPTLTIMSYNVDKAVREEQFEKTKWINRSPRVAQLINEVKADIVCLQELRELPNTPSVNRFLSEFDQYRFVIAHRGPSKLSFGQATLYDPEKVFPVDSFPQWLSDTPEEVSDTWAQKRDAAWGNIVLCTKFLLVHQGRIVKNAPAFWVFNTHFGLDEEVKTKSCYKLLEIINKTAKKQPYIVCGDFNLFPDKDGNKQRKILTEQMKDLGKDAETLSGKKVEGTFIGFDHDEFKADLKNMTSRLDHIFGSETVETVSPVIIYTKTMLPEEPEELTTRDYPSDHLPLVAKLKLLGKSTE